MPDNELSKETKEKLELARSKVRRLITYGAGALLAFLVIWGTVWMADRSAMVAGIQACLAVIFYWFGVRSVKPPEVK